MSIPSASAGLKLASAIGALVLIADQLSKWAALEHLLNPPRVVEATPFLNFVLGFNTGVSFGLFGNDSPYGPWLLSVIALIIVALLIVWAVRSRSRAEVIAYGAIAGGALGNVVDRVRQGAVTDFLDLHAFGWHWPTFNIADVGITGGVGLLILAGLRQGNGAQMTSDTEPASKQMVGQPAPVHRPGTDRQGLE